MTREEILLRNSGQIDSAVEQMIQCGAIRPEQAPAERERIVALLQQVYSGSASEEQRIEASAILSGKACTGEQSPSGSGAAAGSGFSQIAAIAIAALLLFLLVSGRDGGEDDDDYFSGPKTWRI